MRKTCASFGITNYENIFFVFRLSVSRVKENFKHGLMQEALPAIDKFLLSSLAGSTLLRL
jgi:hypothetical protein